MTPSPPVQQQQPQRPFATRRESPASSTGDSSSGRAPLTPRDGSDIGVETNHYQQQQQYRSQNSYSGHLSNNNGNGGVKFSNMKKDKDRESSESTIGYSGGASGLMSKAQMKKQMMHKRRSVSFEEDVQGSSEEWRNSRMSGVSTVVGSGGKNGGGGGGGYGESGEGGRSKKSQEVEMEERRKERRREEAKAAIEVCCLRLQKTELFADAMLITCSLAK
jgi:serine/arginine repetitive matrix protein 2